MGLNVSVDSLNRAISEERVAPYLASAGGDVDLAWAAYRWNLDLVSAMMPLICDVEITLRNTIHFQLSEQFGTSQWWTHQRLLLDDNTREMMSGVVRKHRKKLAKGSEGPGRVIADLTFGVWVNLLSRGSVTALQQNVDYEANLWRKSISHGFRVGDELNARGLPKRPIRRHVHDAAANLQALRNAAGHHRNISNGIRPPGRPAEYPRLPLLEIAESGVELLGWMSPELASLHDGLSHLKGQIARRPTS